MTTSATRQAEFRVGDTLLAAPPGQPLLMGILNAGPDSFSDPGRRSLDELVRRGLSLVEQGAAIVDVGGESGRTDRPPVPVEVEIERVVPVIRRLAEEGVLVSIDTWRSPVARAALEAGARLVNDMTALSDPRLLELCAQTGASLVLCHTRAAPKSAGPRGDGADVLPDVIGLLAELRDRATAAGIAPDRLLLDPGIDVAKTPYQSVRILRQLERLHALGCALLVACSRKDFIGAICGRPPAERLGGTLAAVARAADAGAQLVRVHDVAQVRDFLAVRAALSGAAAVAPDLVLAEELRRQAPPEAVTSDSLPGRPPGGRH